MLPPSSGTHHARFGLFQRKKEQNLKPPLPGHQLNSNAPTSSARSLQNSSSESDRPTRALSFGQGTSVASAAPRVTSNDIVVNVPSTRPRTSTLSLGQTRPSEIGPMLPGPQPQTFTANNGTARAPQTPATTSTSAPPRAPSTASTSLFGAPEKALEQAI
ncbi:hypothetical protein LTS18_001711, partial [Coniosporium uncinatum]